MDINMFAISRNRDSFADALLEVLRRPQDGPSHLDKQKVEYYREFAMIYQNYREITLELVRRLGFVLPYASDELQKDREIILAALENIHSLSEDDMAVATETMKIYDEMKFYGNILLPNADDKEIVIAAVKCNKAALMFASDELQKDAEVLAAAGS